MGETQNQPFQLSFNASLRVDFQGSRVTERLRRTANKPPCPAKGQRHMRLTRPGRRARLSGARGSSKRKSMLRRQKVPKLYRAGPLVTVSRSHSHSQPA